MSLLDPKGFLSQVHPDLRALAGWLAADIGPSLDLKITSGHRSFEEQAKLYAQGRTEPGEVITNAEPGESAHNWGCAIDVVPMKGGVALWSDTPTWDRLGSAARRFASAHPNSERIAWGGNWSQFRDRPHFEIAAWRAIKNGWKPKGSADTMFLVAIAAALLLVFVGGFI